MLRALELAERGRSTVSPNPMVGCVIVHNDTIIGEGFHRNYGDAHAEVNAINSVKDTHLLAESTLYVTLEPCSHFGKTPPCANLIVDKGIPKVVVCNKDPNPLVAGKGIAILRNAGIEVIEGLLEERGLELNKRFFTYHAQKRPYIILKWAQTGDGFIARENYDSKWISDELSRTLSHKWRSEEDAIMVGTNTALHDNPSLANRDWSGDSPIRLLIDRSLKVPSDSKLFDQSQTTICYNSVKDESHEYNQYVKIDFSQDIISQILQDLYKRKIQSVIVEGGSTLLNSFIHQNLWDEARVFVSHTQTFGKGIAAPLLRHFMPYSREELLGDSLIIYRNYKND